MGGDNHDHDHEVVHVNLNNIKETDAEMPYKVRDIELIKQNPNLFHMWIYSPADLLEIAGGPGFLATAALGGLLGFGYISRKLAHNPAHFYSKSMQIYSRCFLGAIVGSWVGYMKFGDRQRL